MLDEGFRTVEQGMYKLSGFLVVSKAMFELGPQWLDRYVRMFMAEVIADELEDVDRQRRWKQKANRDDEGLRGVNQGGVYRIENAESACGFHS